MTVASFSARGWIGLLRRVVGFQELGRTGGEAGDDAADVEAEGGGLDAGTGAPRLRPGLGPIHRLGIATQHGRLRERTAGADIVGDDLDGTIERAVAGKPEHKVDVVFARRNPSLPGGRSDYRHAG